MDFFTAFREPRASDNIKVHNPFLYIKMILQDDIKELKKQLEEINKNIKMLNDFKKSYVCKEDNDYIEQYIKFQLNNFEAQKNDYNLQILLKELCIEINDNFSLKEEKTSSNSAKQITSNK